MKQIFTIYVQCTQIDNLQQIISEALVQVECS